MDNGLNKRKSSVGSEIVWRYVLKKRILSVACMLMSAAMIISMAQPLKATSLEDTAAGIEQEQNKQEQLKGKLEDAKQILGDLEQLKSDTTLYIAALDDKMASLTDYIIDLNQQIEEKMNEINEIGLVLEEQEKDIESQYEAMKKRIKFLYENGQIEYLDMILNSGNISELLNRAEYLSKITEYDRDMFNKLKETKEQIEATEKQLEDEHVNLNILRLEAEQEQEQVEQLVDAKAEVLRHTNAQIEQTQSDMETMEGELAASEAMEKELEAMEAKIREQMRQEEERKRQEEERKRQEEEKKRQEEEDRKKQEEEDRKKQEQQNSDSQKDDQDSDSGNNQKDQDDNDDNKQDQKQNHQDDDDDDDQKGRSNTNGKFNWPLPGYYYISSGYVHRINPVTGKAENHSGIDIPAPAGTYVRAAGSGTVAWAWRSATAGNWVGINHGNGILTVYMHMSGFNCSEGDYVKTGDVIGFVGSTGQSTGNHLHFSVRVDGSYVNPMDYLD